MADVLGLQRESLDLSMRTLVFAKLFGLAGRVTVGLPALSHLCQGCMGMCVCVCVSLGMRAGGQVPKV